MPYTDSMVETWPFKKELAVVRGLKSSKGKKDIKNYQPDYTVPEDIEFLFFGKMDKGQRLDDMTTARDILRELEERGSVTKPRFPQATWDVSIVFVSSHVYIHFSPL